MRGVKDCSLAFLVLPVFASLTFARVMAPEAIPDRVGRVDGVIVGKVLRIEDKTVEGPDNTVYRVAIVEITEKLTGFKDAKNVRVGFLEVTSRAHPPRLTPGMEGLFFLTYMTKIDLVTMHFYFDFVDRKSPSYITDLEMARRCARLLANPIASLKSNKEEDRLLTVSALLALYRSPFKSSSQQEPIDADQSRLILETLAKGNWASLQMDIPSVNPQLLFYRLGLTPKDGWMPPRDNTTFEAEAKKWLSDHAATYRIRRFVKS